MNEFDLVQVLGSWSTGPVRAIEHLTSGSNNENWMVETQDGDYVLRLYRNVDAEEHINYEQALLKELAAAGVGFEVPVPIPTSAGETMVQTRRGLVSLARRIAGEHPRPGDEADTRAAGAGLADLDLTIASLTSFEAERRRHPNVSGSGDLLRIHPAVTGPEQAIALLDRADDRAKYERILEETEVVWSGLVASLPNQVIHSDYVRTNILLRDGAVAGILDFEFSGPDLRAMDLAVGIYHFCLRPWIGVDEVKTVTLIRAFVAGFLEGLDLSPDELEALPTLLLRRQLAAGLHWLGRWKVGISSEEEARERFSGLVALGEWLDREGAALFGDLALVSQEHAISLTRTTY